MRSDTDEKSLPSFLWYTEGHVIATKRGLRCIKVHRRDKVKRFSVAATALSYIVFRCKELCFQFVNIENYTHICI